MCDGIVVCCPGGVECRLDHYHADQFGESSGVWALGDFDGGGDAFDGYRNGDVL
jgi:hypothetical protein